MKIAILGDTHFGIRNGDIAFHAYYRKFYDFFIDYLIDNNITVVIQTGDLFDNRRFININSLKLVREYFFDRLLKHNIKLHTIIGNHDIFHKNTVLVNSPDLLFGDYSNITIHNRINTTKIDDIAIDFVPWICSENHDEIIEFIENSKSKLCVGHFELNNFCMYRGIPHLNGEFDANLLKNYKLTISGHFHHKSSFKNIHYVGTPYQLTWADYEDDRGFHILDSDTLKLDFHHNSISIFQKIIYDDVIQDIEYWTKTFDYNILKDTFIKLIVNNKTNPSIFDAVLDKIQQIEILKLSIVENYNDSSIENGELDDESAQDTMAILNHFIDENDMSLDKNKFKTIMNGIYMDALNVGESD